MPRLDVVYVTYRKDLQWICYSVQLLHKFFKADFHTIIIGEPDCEEVFKTWGLVATSYRYVKPWPDGYMFAMYQKMIADLYSDAEMIMLLDSDHILLESVGLERFTFEGLPIVRYKFWDEDKTDFSLIEGKKQWKPPTERLLGVELDKDYMRGPPFLFWRDTFAKTRLRIEEVTAKPFMEAVYSDTPYDYRRFLTHPKTNCDYESLGLYCAKFQPGRYVFVHDKGERWPFRVFWSHGHWGYQLQMKLDNLLKTPEPFNGDTFIEPEVRALVYKHDIQLIVETGTADGSTTQKLAQICPVTTVELDPELFEKGKGLEYDIIERHLGDSALVLQNLQFGSRTLFYLDAHGGGHCPLLDELAVIAAKEIKPVIVIHDFENPGRPEFGYDTWDIGPLKFETIRESLNKIYGSENYRYHYNAQACGQRRGVIYIEPA